MCTSGLVPHGYLLFVLPNYLLISHPDPVFFATLAHSFGNCLLHVNVARDFMHQHPKWVSLRAGNT